MRTRVAVSMMRAAILSRRMRRVVNWASGERLRLGDGVTHGQHQPVGGGVQHEADLIGEWRAATGAVGGELALVQLDQVFGLTARTIEGVVEPLGAAALEVGDDVADVEPLGAGLDARGDAALAAPGLGAIAGLGVAAHAPAPGSRRAAPGHRRRSISTRRLSTALPGRPKNVVEGIGFAPRHHFGTAVMTIAADGQARVRPMTADAAHQAAQMAADFVSGRCLAGPQQHRHRARGGSVVDMDRQEAPFIVVSVEQRELLMAVHDVDGVVDVQRDRGGRRVDSWSSKCRSWT